MAAKGVPGGVDERVETLFLVMESCVTHMHAWSFFMDNGKAIGEWLRPATRPFSRISMNAMHPHIFWSGQLESTAAR